MNTVKISTGRDVNGNTTIIIKKNIDRATSIQALELFQGKAIPEDKAEIFKKFLVYIAEHGTKTQKTIFSMNKGAIFSYYKECQRSTQDWIIQAKRAEESPFCPDIEYLIRHAEFLLDGNMGYYGRIIGDNIQKSTARANKPAMLGQATLRILGFKYPGKFCH